MANRVLRDWTQSETVDNLSSEAERFFTRLIMKADDYGCFYGNSKLLNAALFPLKNFTTDQITTWRNECAESGLILIYSDSGKEYVQILNFGQRLRTMASKFPRPADNPPSDDSDPLPIVSNPPPETKRNEGEEKVKGKFTSELYLDKQTAFESIRDNDQYIEECNRTLTGRGWGSSDKVDVIGLLSYFMNCKVDLEKPPDDIRRHFKNWLVREKLDNLQTFAQVFKKSLNGRQTA